MQEVAEEDDEEETKHVDCNGGEFKGHGAICAEGCTCHVPEISNVHFS